jgi:hypothetical protein
VGLIIQREASRLYTLYLDALIEQLPAEVVEARKSSWELAGDFYDLHLQACRQKDRIIQDYPELSGIPINNKEKYP